MRWAAPEILRGLQTRSKQGDVYALGMTLIEVITGVMPFGDKENMAVWRAVVVEKLIPERPKIFPSFTPDEAEQLWGIVVDACAHDASDRPDSRTIQRRLQNIRQPITQPSANRSTVDSIPIVTVNGLTDGNGERGEANEMQPPIIEQHKERYRKEVYEAEPQLANVSPTTLDSASNHSSKTDNKPRTRIGRRPNIKQRSNSLGRPGSTKIRGSLRQPLSGKPAADISSVPFPGGGHPGYTNLNAGYFPSDGYGMGGMGMPPQPIPSAVSAGDPYANVQPGTLAYAKSEGPDGIDTYIPVIARETIYQTPSGPNRGIEWVTATSSQASAAGTPRAITTNNTTRLPRPNAISMPSMSASMPPPGSISSGYPPESPVDDYPVMRLGISQRDYDKAVKKWERDRRAAKKRAHKEEEYQKAQDPYDIAGRRGPELGLPRSISTGNFHLGFERAGRMSGGANLRDDELSRKLEELDISFNSRRGRRMNGSNLTSLGSDRYKAQTPELAFVSNNPKLDGHNATSGYAATEAHARALTEALKLAGGETGEPDEESSNAM
ncbi:kinase suppressor of Ras 2 [Ceratobasidium sp. 428]|nr:kinase suppressor of Ras 2 [Ceratobasidium sp. 428]